MGVRLPCLRLAAALRHSPHPDAMAFLIERTGRRRVLEATEAAARAGVRPGMALREATRLVPRAAVALDDPVRAERTWRRVLDVLARVPGVVEADARAFAPGFALVRIPFADRPERWFARVRERLAPLGLDVRCGAASNAFVAYVATYRAADAVCRPGGEAAFVADAPLEVLRIDDDVSLRLRLLGVTTLGRLAALPLPYLRRFGPDALRWHELAHGHAEPVAAAGAAGVW